MGRCQDVSWSGVYQAQIDGRAWRYGQKMEVLVYHLLARGTTDIIMNGNALEKHSMMSALLDREENQSECALFSVSIVAHL